MYTYGGTVPQYPKCQAWMHAGWNDTFGENKGCVPVVLPLTLKMRGRLLISFMTVLKVNTSGQIFEVAVMSQSLCAAKCFTLITGFDIRDRALTAHYWRPGFRSRQRHAVKFIKSISVAVSISGMLFFNDQECPWEALHQRSTQNYCCGCVAWTDKDADLLDCKGFFPGCCSKSQTENI